MTNLSDRMSVKQALGIAHALTELDDLIRDDVTSGTLVIRAHRVDVMILGRRVAEIAVDEQGNSDLAVI